MLLIVDSALQKDNPYCREVAICKKGRSEGGGGRDPARGGKICHGLISPDFVITINFPRNFF